jgi:ATP-binding cassette subfamily B protein
MKALLAHPSPCILHVLLENRLQHYVVYFGSTLKEGKQHLIIGDPAKGIIYLTPEQLDAIWQSKVCLILSKNNSFLIKKDIVNVKKIWFKELIKMDSSLLLVAAIIGIVLATLSLTMSIFSQRLIDDFIPKKQYNKVYLGIFLVFLLLIIKEGLALIRTQLLIKQSKDFNLRIVKDFFSRILYLPKSFFDTRKIGELTARLHDTNRIQRVVSQIAGNTLLDLIILIVTLIFIFAYSFIAGLITLAFLPFFFLLIYRKNKKISKAQRSTMEGYAMAESNYISTLQGTETIKNYNKEQLFSESNNNIYNSYQSAVYNLGQLQMKLSFTANVFATSLLCSLLLYLSILVLQNKLKAGELMAIIGMVASLLPSVANLAMLTIPINEAKIAFNRMYEFVGIENKEHGCKQISSFELLEVNHLSYRYKGHSNLIKNISFSIQKGEIIALMGENGSGKSTISQILQKHYDCESGSIYINNNVELNSLSFETWRNIIGVVPQQVHIFNATVLENIAFDDATTKTQDVLDFLKRYEFTKFIDSLPQSFMTLVGEEGINLSGGQKQMIALARALYHKPQLLILDEATASMDRESEQFVLKLLTELKKSMGIIFITHRLHVLKSFCDRIYILENGETSVSGNHEALLLSDNLYSQYWNDLMIQ